MKPKRTLSQAISWWWNARVKSLWSVKLPAAIQAQSAQSEFGFEHIADELSQPTEQSVTAILTVYKRGQYLSAQIEALRNQSVPPSEIWVWCNSSDVQLQDYSTLADRVVVSNTNWKFWGRFALANMARTQYVCLFDDDILPQVNWIKNCLATINNGTNGILGGSGVLLPAVGGYSSWENGEDIHFSAMALKHGGVATFVPPHPEDDHSLWSCRPDFGKSVGRQSSATYKSESHHNDRDSVVDACRADGWRIVADKTT